MSVHLIVTHDDPTTTRTELELRGSDPLDEAVVGGVREDFIQMYSKHYPRLIRALELGGSTRPAAEDYAQEAFARTLGHWRRVRRGTNPPGYVYRVAFRLAWRQASVEVHTDFETQVTDVAAEATLQVEIETTLKRMPDARRRCAVLCLVTGMSTKDAAVTLRIAESTVRKQIERARADLHLAIDEPS